jgi:hypothetical protein
MDVSDTARFEAVHNWPVEPLVVCTGALELCNRL